MSYSLKLENDVILTGLTDDIILGTTTDYIKEIYKIIDDKKVMIYELNSPGSKICNEDFNDNDIKIVHKFDVNSINKIPIL
jgi:hypothetical protein